MRKGGSTTHLDDLGERASGVARIGPANCPGVRDIPTRKIAEYLLPISRPIPCGVQGHVFFHRRRDIRAELPIMKGTYAPGSAGERAFSREDRKGSL